MKLLVLLIFLTGCNDSQIVTVFKKAKLAPEGQAVCFSVDAPKTIVGRYCLYKKSKK